MSERTEIDCGTGVARTVPLTPEEIAQRTAWGAGRAAERDADAISTTERSAARARVVQVAQGTVGVHLDRLTATQVRALLAVLLWEAGALNGDGTVRSPAQWIRD